MSRQILMADVLIPATDYNHPERRLKKGQTIELSAAEITAITGAGGVVRGTVPRDQLGEGVGVTN